MDQKSVLKNKKKYSIFWQLVDGIILTKTNCINVMKMNYFTAKPTPNSFLKPKV